MKQKKKSYEAFAMGTEGRLEVRVLVKVVLELGFQRVIVDLEKVVLHLFSAYHPVSLKNRKKKTI
jgi:hypothetical protein